MVRGVRIRGPFTGPSGYDHHVREFVRALSSRGVPLQLENLKEWSPVRLARNLRDPWFESLSKKVEAGVTLHFSMPTQVKPHSSGSNVNFTMFEATRIPPSWVSAHPASDLIVLPTQHSFRAWADSGVPESKLRLCPLGVRSDLFRPGVRPLTLVRERGRPIDAYRTRFLNVSEQGPRKNLTGLMRCWLRATTPDDDAVLIMKVGCYSPGSMAALDEEKAEAQRSAGKTFRQAAPVHFLFDLFPDADVPRLFAAATHYISLSRGEGWDLSMMEAAVSGLRLIAPEHSGYLAYLDPEVASLVPSRSRPAIFDPDSWMNQLFQGLTWWQPDEEVAVELIRAAIEGRDEPRAPARERIAPKFTWDNAAACLIEILDEAEAMASR